MAHTTETGSRSGSHARRSLPTRLAAGIANAAGRRHGHGPRTAGSIEDGITALSASIAGKVLLPGDDGWDAARGAYNLVVDQRPRIIARPARAADVVEIVRFAARHGLTVVPQRTGHNAEPLGSVEGMILLRTDDLMDIQIDSDRQRVTVGAGVKWLHVVPQLSELGFHALHGSTGDVSIVGYSLGGGVGWYGRKHGLATNSVTRIQLVTADGRLRWVDQDNEPELFWALRGGGGNFGVVTALEFKIFPVRAVYAGHLFFPLERAAEVLHAWNAWTRTVPDEMTSVGRMIQIPPIEEAPEPLRGKAFSLVEVFFLGDEDSGAELVRPLRELGPVMDTVAMVPPAALAEMHMDPPEPVPYQGGGLVLGDLTAEAVDGLVAACGPGANSPLISVEIRHLGGAFSRPLPGHGALDRMPGEYMLFGVGAVTDAVSSADVHAALSAMTAPMSPLASGLFSSFVEKAVDPAELFRPEVYRRLRAVRAAVDPTGMIRANHSIPAAAPDGR
ncbi:MAG: FAD-binding oxidoreductase [Frankia sp.]|nr:FAD-binding oxidoreductase [Frankia sp.]